MHKLIRIFLYIISLLWLFIFVYITFFSDQYKGLKNTNNFSETGYFSIEENGSGQLDKTKLVSIGEYDFSNEQSILLDKTARFDRFYSNYSLTGSYNRIHTGSTDIINIGLGEFFLDFKDHLKNYSIKNDLFKVEIIQPGSLYIRNTGKTLGFYSFDGIYKVTLNDYYSEKEATVFYVHPGMYAKGKLYKKIGGVDESSEVENELFYINNLQISAKKNSNVSESKILMYSFSFIYYKGDIDSTIGASYELKKILQVSKESKFIDNIFLYRQKSSEEYLSNYDYLDELITHKIEVIDKIKDSFSFFLNDSKKVIHYKNMLLGDLSKLVKNVDISSKTQKVLSENDKITIEEIIKTLEILKNLSEKDYNDFIKLVDDTYYYFTYSYSSNFSTKYSILNLYLKVHGGNIKKFDVDFMYLSHLFFLHNKTIRELSVKELELGLIKYIVSYSNSIVSPEESDFFYYYYAYNKILVNHLKNVDNKAKGMEDIMRVLKDIDFINKGYFINKDIKKGMLYINADIIESIINYIGSYYFEEDRDSDDLLVLNNHIGNISDNLIGNIESNVEKLFRYKELSSVLNTKKESELSLLQKYERLKILSNEYFRAIKDNDEYINEEAYSALDNISNYNNNDESSKLTVEKAKKYLSQFVQVDLRSTHIKVVDEEYYEITNIKVINDIISFDLYPLEHNKIINIKRRLDSATHISDILGDLDEFKFTPEIKTKITVKEFEEYLLNIGNIRVFPENITVKNGVYYEVKNVNIGGLKYDFSFFPNNANKISSVMEGLGISYKLNNVKPSEDSRDFSVRQTEYLNFFVNIMKINKVEEIIVVNEPIEDSSDNSDEVNIFKNDFLFGKKGDFIGLNNYINLKFNNVDVKYDDGKYSTHINAIDMISNDSVEKTNRGEIVQAKVSANYIIEEKDHYFKNLKIKFYFVKNSREDITYDMGGKELSIIGKVKVGDFVKFYEGLWEDYSILSKIETSRKTVLGDIDITSLRYTVKNRNMSISYKYKDSYLNVILLEGKIKKITYKDKVYEDKLIRQIDDIFRKIR